MLPTYVIFNEDSCKCAFIPGTITHQDAAHCPFLPPVSLLILWCPFSHLTGRILAGCREACPGSGGACYSCCQLLPRSLLRTQLSHKVRGRKRIGLVTSSLGASASPSLCLPGKTLSGLSTPSSPSRPRALPWCT